MFWLFIQTILSVVPIRDRNTGIPFTGIPVYRTILQYRITGTANAVIPSTRYYYCGVKMGLLCDVDTWIALALFVYSIRRVAWAVAISWRATSDYRKVGEGKREGDQLMSRPTASCNSPSLSLRWRPSLLRSCSITDHDNFIKYIERQNRMIIFQCF